MIRLSPMIFTGLLLWGSFSTSQAATLKNIDILTSCIMTVDYNGMKSQKKFPLPSPGESTEIDLEDEKIIHMQCSIYEGKGRKKTFCIVPHGLKIKTLKAFNEKDVFGDYPACKAE